MSLNFLEKANDWHRVENLDFLEEDREMAHVWSVAYKEKIKKYYVKHMRLRDFQVGDFILRRVDSPRKKSTKGKMAVNWEGPYRIAKSLKNEAYRPKIIYCESFLRTWNSS